MDIFAIVLLFAVGSVAGWIFEVVGNLFVQQKKLVNPGFLSGPYLPAHGFGLLLFFLIASLDMTVVPKVILFTAAATGIELACGLVLLYYFNIRVWDYSKHFLNFKGLIAPAYSFLWLVLSVVFYFFIYPVIPQFIIIVRSYEYSMLLLGVFYGVFFIDAMRSFMIANNIKRFFKEMKSKRIRTVKMDYDAFREKVAASLKKRHGKNFLSRYMLSFRSLEGKDLTRQLKGFLIVKKRAPRVKIDRRRKMIKE